jgi:RimJ/RimL family protein N-acetyltransferase
MDMDLKGKVLETERLILVPLTLEHVDVMLSWANDPAVTGNSQFFRDNSDRGRIESFIKDQMENPYLAYFAAFVKPEYDEDGIGYVGNVHLLNVNRIHNHCQGGITLRQSAWNHGFAQELMPAVMRFAFDELGMYRFYLQIFTTNDKGMHLWSKLGFQQEGVLRAAYRLGDTYHDMYSLSFLRPDFNERYPYKSAE